MWVNRKASYEFKIEATREAGIVLVGGEVKSVRKNGVSLHGVYAQFSGNELWLYNLSIDEYCKDHFSKYQAKRPKKLLFHSKELKRWYGFAKSPGYSFIPLKAYFNDRGLLKFEMGLCVGKGKRDKRAAEKEKAFLRELREISEP